MCFVICAAARPAYKGPMPDNPSPNPPTPDADTVCASCLKPASLCVCDGVVPVANRIALLILQHPQEQDKTLGTARLTVRHLTKASLKIGLSWPSLAKALGQPADPHRWAVLYLGSAKAETAAPGHEVVAVDAKGVADANQAAALAHLQGVIVLDGTWSQAKALWWRNAWLLKCRRVILGPRHPSRYGKLRYEPRKDSLSTLEAAALLLSRLEGKPEIETALGASFQRLLDRYRATLGSTAGATGTRRSRPRAQSRDRRAHRGPTT